VSMTRDKIWEDYMYWLTDKVDFDIGKYSRLAEQLHNSPFEWPLDRDVNRGHDGLSLRDEYLSDSGLNGSFSNTNPMVLEVLVAFAIRINNEYIGDPGDEHPEIIFWEMLCNLHLDRCDDRHFNGDYVYEILGKWINREFDYNGNGSIFPLKHTKRDQRRLEMWSQMQEYLSENY